MSRKILAVCLLSLIAVLAGTGAKGCSCPQQIVKPPEIISFTCTKDNINPGEESELTWSVYDADEIWIEGPGVSWHNLQHFGSRPVSPSVTSTYTLNATRTSPTVPVAVSTTTIHVNAAKWLPNRPTQGGTTVPIPGCDNCK